MAESAEEVFWLWEESGKVGWSSPSGRGHADRALPSELDLCRMRSGFDQAEIGTELGRASGLAEAVCRILDEQRNVRLLLLRDLANERETNDWTRVPFEWMRRKGAPLHGRLSVDRFVSRQAVEPLERPVLRREVMVFKRLRPQDDDEFTAALCPDRRLPRFDDVALVGEADSAVAFVDLALDLDQLSALVLVCHGTETDRGAPFRLPDGSAWSLPRDRGMPPLVVLLVCGTDSGNLLGYARDDVFLLPTTQTVIVSAGKLGLHAAGKFLRRLLEEWSDGRTVYEILRDAQADLAGQPDGLDVRRLCLMGRGDLRLDAPSGGAPSRRWQETPDAELAARIRNGTDDDAAAITTLVNRSTLKCLLEGTRTYEEELLRRLGPQPESFAALLNQCLQIAGGRGPSPVQLWGLSGGWIRLALGQQRALQDEPHRRDFMAFPLPGDPGRPKPGFEIEELPSPLAIAWKQLNDTLDRQQLPHGRLLLKEAFELAVRFVASVAVMDLLRASGKEHEDCKDLIQHLFAAKTTLGASEWVECLRLALRDKGARRMNDRLRSVLWSRRQSRLMDTLTGEYVAWQNEDDYDMRSAAADLVPQLQLWLERLREFLEAVSSALEGWTFNDGHDGTCWQGNGPHALSDGQAQQLDGEPASVVMAHEDGRSLELSPLITVQHCDQCGQRRVFFFTERRAGTAGAGAEFRDYPNEHGAFRPHVHALGMLAPKLLVGTGPRLGDDAARAEEEQLANRNIDRAEKPRYLYEKVQNACDDLDDAHGAGYVHLVGPEGFGKSWFAHMFAEDHRGIRGKRVLLCPIRALGRNGAAEFIDHLCAQAVDQRLGHVEDAREQALKKDSLR